MSDDTAYALAVADGLAFALGEGWQRLAAIDPAISLATVRASLAATGAETSFGDGELPSVPDPAGGAVASVRDQLRRIRDAAPRAFTAGADTYQRILCTDPWPRIYTTAVLDIPATSPVHVIQCSDLAHRRDQWQRVGQLAQFGELRVLVMFGSPLARSPWPFDLAAFPELRALDVSHSQLRALPPSLAAARSLESLELAGNPLDAASLGVLAALPALRYVGLRGTGLTRADCQLKCEVAFDEADA